MSLAIKAAEQAKVVNVSLSSLLRNELLTEAIVAQYVNRECQSSLQRNTKFEEAFRVCFFLAEKVCSTTLLVSIPRHTLDKN